MPIEEVIEKYANTVWRLALAHMKSRHDAEDVFQDVFLKYIGDMEIPDLRPWEEIYDLLCAELKI